MESLIQERIRTKKQFAWKNEAHRYNAGILAAGGADADVSTTARTPVDDLMRCVISQAGEKVGERWPAVPSEGEPASTPTPAKPMMFEAILNLFADTNEELYVKDVVEKIMDVVNPADVPPELSSTHLILVALSFLSTPIPGLGTGVANNEGGVKDDDEGTRLLRDTFPLMPLLENVSGLSAKITWRTYKLAYSDWKGLRNDEALRRKVQNLDAAFTMSTVAYQARYCLTPRLTSTEEEREVLRTGFVPASTGASVSAGAMPSGSRPNTPTPTAKKRKIKKEMSASSSISAT